MRVLRRTRSETEVSWAEDKISYGELAGQGLWDRVRRLGVLQPSTVLYSPKESLVCFRGRVSVCSPGILCVKQAGLELSEILLPVS